MDNGDRLLLREGVRSGIFSKSYHLAVKNPPKGQKFLTRTQNFSKSKNKNPENLLCLHNYNYKVVRKIPGQGKNIFFNPFVAKCTLVSLVIAIILAIVLALIFS